MSGKVSDEMRLYFIGMCDTTKNSIAYCQKYHDTIQYHNTVSTIDFGCISTLEWAV